MAAGGTQMCVDLVADLGDCRHGTASATRR